MVIVFEYKDKYTKGEWRKQSCSCETLEDCIKWYGLGVDCEYRIVSIEEE